MIYMVLHGFDITSCNNTLYQPFVHKENHHDPVVKQPGSICTLLVEVQSAQDARDEFKKEECRDGHVWSLLDDQQHHTHSSLANLKKKLPLKS